MILQNLSAWITNSQGEPLEEFKRTQVSENTVECWIPSTERENFRIRWRAIRNFEPGLELYCRIKLDGRTVSGGVLSARKISQGISGEKTGMTIGPGLKRYYVFGRQRLTDCDELASPNNPMPELGTIRVSLLWTGRSQPEPNQICTFKSPAEPQLIHERVVKKGHGGAVGLGDIVFTPWESKAQPKSVDMGLPQLIFVFRYGPRDWLSAQGIVPDIPCAQAKSTESPSRDSITLKRKLSSTDIESIQSHSNENPDKRTRTYESSEVIDVDELETDNESDVVVLDGPTKPRV